MGKDIEQAKTMAREAITPKQLIKILENHGFELKRSKGSHHIFRHSDGRRTVVPVHSKD